MNETQNKTTELLPLDAGREDFSTKGAGVYRFDPSGRNIPPEPIAQTD